MKGLKLSNTKESQCRLASKYLIFCKTALFIIVLVTAFIAPTCINVYASYFSPSLSNEGGRLKRDLISKLSYNESSYDEETPAYVIQDKNVDEFRGDMEVTGNIPVVIMNNHFYEKEINERITAEYENMKSMFINRQAKVDFKFEVKSYNGYVSVLLHSEINTGANSIYVKSFNFKEDTGEAVTINTVLGSNGVKLANKAIESEINKNIDIYKSNFAGIDEGHDFYIEDNMVFIVFDKYEIAPGYRGVVEFPINISQITELTITEYDYRVRTDYLIKMIMLKQVADAFNMTLEWDEKEQFVEVYSSTNRLLSKITIGKNLYIKGKSTTVVLETSPELEYGRTFVPVSFFDEILNITYSINSDGSITFSQYK